MNQLQCSTADEPDRDTEQRAVFPAEGQADFRSPSFRRPWGSATLNIQRLEEMATQRFHLDRRAERRPAFPQVRRAAAGELISAMSWSSIWPA